ncbi:MAG TPA: DUF1786 domain-containing protein [Candidatus Brocadiia bacterium]|nr:DUF1786 domain-containing protein [Planctomycetota bacterium]MDO8092974.1 DUF1786 domain-containing protein [Candidatus Brocadiales bacterium]
MTKPFRLLAIDIGAGTQDILLYDEGKPIENCFKLVLPSRTVIIAGQIERATSEYKDIFLCGNIMGGGKCVSAIKRHLQKGLHVYSTPLAAKTIRDNPSEVESLGVKIVESRPPHTTQIELSDIDLCGLRTALACFEVEMPERFAIAVLDHGECLNGSNREFRFKLWKEFIESGGLLKDLVYEEPPPYFTRMKAVQEDVGCQQDGRAIVMQTGPAAIWGTLFDAVVAPYKDKGLTIVNIGNQHTLAVLFQGEKIWGLFEHHTSSLTPEKLKKSIIGLQQRTLTNKDIFDDGGHGCVIDPACPEDNGFEFVAVVGPRRRLVEGLNYYFAAPYGDMMLTGCFGLVAAYKLVTPDLIRGCQPENYEKILSPTI